MTRRLICFCLPVDGSAPFHQWLDRFKKDYHEISSWERLGRSCLPVALLDPPSVLPAVPSPQQRPMASCKSGGALLSPLPVHKPMRRAQALSMAWPPAARGPRLRSWRGPPGQGVCPAMPACAVICSPGALCGRQSCAPQSRHLGGLQREARRPAERGGWTADLRQLRVSLARSSGGQPPSTAQWRAAEIHRTPQPSRFVSTPELQRCSRSVPVLPAPATTPHGKARTDLETTKASR